MQKALKFTGIAALGLISLGAAFAGGPVPRKAPEFVIQSTNGKQTLLSSYRGKVVVLAFMFTTCTHCQKLTPILAQLQKEYAEKGVQVLGATWDQDARNNVDRFNQVFGVNFPCGYTSSENVLQFLQQPASEPPFVPIVIFIDRAGTIRAQHYETGDRVHDAAEDEFFLNPETSIRAGIEKLLKTGPASARK